MDGKADQWTVHIEDPLYFFNFTLHIGKLSDFFLWVTEFLHLGDLNVENQSQPL